MSMRFFRGARPPVVQMGHSGVAVRQGERDYLGELEPFLYLHADDLESDLGYLDVWPNRGTDPSIQMRQDSSASADWTLGTMSNGQKSVDSPLTPFTGAYYGLLRWAGTSATLNPVAVFVGELVTTDPVLNNFWLPGTYDISYWIQGNPSGTPLYRIGGTNYAATPAPEVAHQRFVTRWGDGSAGLATTFWINGTRYVDVVQDKTVTSGGGWRYSPYSYPVKVRALAFFEPSVDLAAVESAVEAQFG